MQNSPTQDRTRFIPLPSPAAFSGPGHADAIAGAYASGSPLVLLHGPRGAGTTAEAVRYASVAAEFDYVYAFDCRGGLWVEEVLVRLGQFLSFHSLTDIKQIVISPMPLSLKLESLSFFLSKIRMLIIVDGVDALLEDAETRRVLDALAYFAGRKALDTRFLLTSSADAGALGLPVDTVASIAVAQSGPGVPVDKIASLDAPALAALTRISAFHKKIAPADAGADPALAADLLAAGLLESPDSGRTFTAHPLVREAVRAAAGADAWASALAAAAAYHERFAREEGVLWHMLYALRLRAEASDRAAVGRVGLELAPPLLSWGHIDLGNAVAMLAADAAAESADAPTQSRALYYVGVASEGMGDLVRAEQCYEQCLALMPPRDASSARAEALVRLGSVLTSKGTIAEAMKRLEPALHIYINAGDRDASSRTFVKLARACMAGGYNDSALKHLKQAIKITEDLGDDENLSFCLYSAGAIYSQQGRFDLAESHLGRARVVRERLKDIAGTADVFEQLGFICQKRAELDKAVEQYHKALALREAARDKDGSAALLTRIGALLIERADYLAAVRSLVIALALYEDLKSDHASRPTEQLERIRASVGDEEFERLSAEAMSEMKGQS